jgi:armadillo repeat-containing protein 6
MFLHPDTWFFHYRTILLNDGVEKLIRKAKMTHASCKDAAMAALRDLGLNNYNA